VDVADGSIVELIGPRPTFQNPHRYPEVVIASAPRRRRHPASSWSPWCSRVGASSPSSAIAAASVPTVTQCDRADVSDDLRHRVAQRLAAKSFHEVQTIVSARYTSVDREDVVQTVGPKPIRSDPPRPSFSFYRPSLQRTPLPESRPADADERRRVSAFAGGFNAVVGSSSAHVKVYAELADASTS